MAAKETARTLVGVVEEELLLHLRHSRVLIGDREADSTVSVKATMLRVAKDLELARYFQERISNLSLSLELARGNGQLAQCSIRYFSDVVLSAPDPDKAWGTRVVDSIVFMENAKLDLIRKRDAILDQVDRGIFLTPGELSEAESYGTEIEKFDATIQ